MPELTPERWQRIDEVFQQAADLPAGERAAFLDAETAGDEDLRKQVEAMLEGLTGNIIAPAIEEAIKEFKGPGVLPDSFSGQRMGGYQLFECIGKGGMGAVYRARREEFDQQVAVKIVHPGIAGGRLANRFLAERRILSSLEHPYIARLIDGGSFEGLPYLVMEFAEGVPVHHFCRDGKLDVRGKLELFRKICAAVQHAHQKLVVHADLKPSNILVLKDGTPKLLDFGVAKLLDPVLGDSGPLTDTGWRPMTPEYASPEQIRGEQITVASDVYSLGIILFLLLTGERPYELKNHSALELEKVVGTSPVALPSTKVKEDTRLRRVLQGDLDNILMMALRKEPERRYQSVERLSEDIRRHLAGQTVMARPDTVTYRVQKFVKRNRVAVGLTAALLVTAVAGTFFTVREGRRAQKRFEQVRALALQVLTEFDPEARKLAGSEKLRQKMVDGSLRYLDSLSGEAAGDPGLRQELALAYHRIADIQGYNRIPNLGRRDLAIIYHRRGLEIEEQLRRRSGDNPELLRSMAVGYARLSEVYARTGEEKQAETMLAKAMELAKPDDPGTYVPVRLQVARRKSQQGELGEALRYLNEAVLRAETEEELALAVLVQTERAEVLQKYGRLEESIEAAKAGLALIDGNREKVKGDVAFVRRESSLWNQWGAVLGAPGRVSFGRYCDAVPYLEKALALRPEEMRDVAVKAGFGLELLQTRALCGQRLQAEAVRQVEGWMGGYDEGLAEVALAVGLDEFRYGKKESGRKRIRAVAERWKTIVGVAAWEILAEFAMADGEREKAWEYLKKGRQLRAPMLEESGNFRYTRLFEQGTNLARAKEWGDRDGSLDGELKRVVEKWPAHQLTRALDKIRDGVKR